MPLSLEGTEDVVGAPPKRVVVAEEPEQEADEDEDSTKETRGDAS